MIRLRHRRVVRNVVGAIHFHAAGVFQRKSEGERVAAVAAGSADNLRYAEAGHLVLVFDGHLRFFALHNGMGHGAIGDDRRLEAVRISCLGHFISGARRQTGEFNAAIVREGKVRAPRAIFDRRAHDIRKRRTVRLARKGYALRRGELDGDIVGCRLLCPGSARVAGNLLGYHQAARGQVVEIQAAQAAGFRCAIEAAGLRRASDGCGCGGRNDARSVVRKAYGNRIYRIVIRHAAGGSRDFAERVGVSRVLAALHVLLKGIVERELEVAIRANPRRNRPIAKRRVVLRIQLERVLARRASPLHAIDLLAAGKLQRASRFIRVGNCDGILHPARRIGSRIGREYEGVLLAFPLGDAAAACRRAHALKAHVILALQILLNDQIVGVRVEVLIRVEAELRIAIAVRCSQRGKGFARAQLRLPIIRAVDLKHHAFNGSAIGANLVDAQIAHADEA